MASPHRFEWNEKFKRTNLTQPTNWINIIIIFDAPTNVIVKKGSELQYGQKHNVQNHRSHERMNEWNETIVFTDTVVGLLVSLEKYLSVSISACEWVRPDEYRGALNNDFVLKMHISFDAISYK